MAVNNAGLNLFSGVPPIPSEGTGRVFWVGNSSTYVPGGVAGTDNAGASGDTPYRPFATVDYAIRQCTASRGDTIYVLPGHAETVAGTIALNVAGVRVIGLGVGALRPTFTYDTVSDVFAITAADCEVSNMIFVCNVANLTRFLSLSATADGAQIHRNIFREGSGTGLSMVEWTGAADDVVIEDNLFYAPTAGNYNEAILIASTPTRGHIRRNFIYGDWNLGGINNALGNVATLFEIADNQVTNLLTNVPAINLDSDVTGMLSRNMVSTDTLASAIDQGIMRCNGNLWANTTDGTSGVPVPPMPAALSNDINNVTLAAANLTGTTTRFTVTNGPILVKRLGFLVTTAVPAGINTLKFSFTPTGGVATDLCGATDTASAGAQQIFVVDGTKLTGLVKAADVGISIAGANETKMPIVLGSGVVQTIFSAGPPATGAGTVFMEWKALNPNATVA